MPGNELEIGRFLFMNIGKFTLPHIGQLVNIGAPNPSCPGFIPITSLSEINLLSSEDSRKKADIYINGKGVSLKQSGASFPYNRLQRANLRDVFVSLGFENVEEMLETADNEVRMFHQGVLTFRSRPWIEFFNENDFRALLEFLMMKGSPNVGMSPHPAELILEAPSANISSTNIEVYTFDEYFERYKDELCIGIRRQWVGQASDSEHGRALGLVRKPGNAPWVYRDIVGEPRSGWRSGFPKEAMRTVYFLMIEK